MLKSIICAAALSLAAASSAYAGMIQSLIGDIDCFGLAKECAPGDRVMKDLGGRNYGEDLRGERDKAEALLTDVWRQPRKISWVHDYDLDGATALSAELQILVAGIANLNKAAQLRADDGTLLGKFRFRKQDDVLQMLTASVPLSLLDGSTGFSLKTGKQDGFIIDHMSLNIVTADNGAAATAIPAPASVALLAAGLAGLGWIQRRSRKALAK
ncbi:MAG: hypothetical protein ACK5HY_02210 [Parahaliea sp.]